MRKRILCPGYNNDVILVRASVDEVLRAIGELYPAARLHRNIFQSDWQLPQNGVTIFVFRLEGERWTYFIYSTVFPQRPLQHRWEQKLSEVLTTQIISYGVGDTAGVVGYDFYDDGVLLRCFGSESEWGKLRVLDVEKTLTQNKLSYEVQRGIKTWTHLEEFFEEHDAIEPGIDAHYLLRQLKNFRAGKELDNSINDYFGLTLNWENVHSLEIT